MLTTIPDDHLTTTERSTAFAGQLSCAILLIACSGAVRASDEVCLVQGTTARWALSYCMSRYETDDEAHPEVSACFSAELARRQDDSSEEDCDDNLAYKSAICSTAIARRSFDGTLSECVRSDEMTPTVVSEGV